MKLFYHIPVLLPELTLDNSNYTHVYLTPDKKKLPSVTTMLSKTKSEADKQSIQEWRDSIGEQVADYILKTAAKIGREAHKLNENYINMEPQKDNYLLLSHAHYKNFIPFLNKMTKIYGVEAKLFSYDMGLAGTADCIAEYNGKLSVIDYKTKRSPQKLEWITDYFIQTRIYAQMWEEITNAKIEQLVVLVSSEQNTVQEFIVEPNDYTNAVNARLTQYNIITKN